MRSLTLACTAIALVAGQHAAQACSPPPTRSPLPTQAQMDRGSRVRYLRAAAVVEVVAETSSTFQRPARMRVLRAYKGNIRVGTVLAVTGVPGSLCGHGDVQAGSRGIMIIDRLSQPLFFRGYMPAAEVARLRRFGLMPPR